MMRDPMTIWQAIEHYGDEGLVLLIVFGVGAIVGAGILALALSIAA